MLPQPPGGVENDCLPQPAVGGESNRAKLTHHDAARKVSFLSWGGAIRLTVVFVCHRSFDEITLRVQLVIHANFAHSTRRRGRVATASNIMFHSFERRERATNESFA